MPALREAVDPALEHRDGGRPRLLLLEPYWTGSHRAWAEGWADQSRWHHTVGWLPGRYWKWRMQAAAITLARRLDEPSPRPDLLLATSMLDLSVFLGLTRRWSARLPAVYYAHETQLTYPQADVDPDWEASRRRRALRDDREYGLINLRAMLAADAVWWNSRYHRDSYLQALPAFLKGFPDHREQAAVRRIRRRSQVMPVGLDLAALDAARPLARRPGPLRVLWNHRWEHDKGPDRLLRLMDAVAARELPVQWVIMGAGIERADGQRAALLERYRGRIHHLGYLPDRAAYAQLLWQSDIVLSTARHDFFGLAVAEALACGCLPLLPADLAYPELLPPDLAKVGLYSDEADCLGRLAAWVEALGADGALVPDARPRAAVRMLDWRLLAPRYDAALSAILQAHAPGV